MEAAAIPQPEEERPDVQALRDRAQAAREEAESLRARVVELRAQAARLDREADELATRPMVVSSPRELLAEEVCVWIRRQRKPKSISEIAEHFGVSAARARAALEMLIESGEVVRTGLKRGTRYRRRRDGESLAAPEPFGQRWHERIRDAAVELRTFTQADMCERFPDLAEPTVYRWLRRLAADGVLERERVGKAYVYAYIPAPVAPLPVRTHARELSVRRSRGSAVQGTGRQPGHARREVRDIVRAAQQQGATVRVQKHGFGIVVDGRVVDAVPKTASDHRSLRNARAALKRHGIDA